MKKPLLSLSLCFVAILCLLGRAGASELPPELTELTPYLNDQKGFEKALRAAGEREMARIGEALAALELLTITGGDIEDARQKYLEAKKWADIIRAGYEAGIERFPKSALLHNYYGELLYDQFGEEDKGVAEWIKAKELDPKEGLPYNNLGIHYMHSGAYELGLEHLDKALKIDPDHPDYLFNMVQAYMNHAPFIEEHRGWKPSKVYSEAMKLSKRAVKNSPEDFELLQDYAFNFWKADSLDAKADWKEAAKAWEAARAHARTDDERFNTWLNEARAWIKIDKRESAISCIEEALKIMPESPVAKQLLEKLQAEEGK